MASEKERTMASGKIRDTNPLVVTIVKALEKNPRPTCLPCQSITSPEHWAPVEMHMSTALAKIYIFEDGICSRCNHKARVVRPRNPNEKY